MSNDENQEQDQGQEPINPWDVPRGQMVPTITGACPHCKGTLGVPIQVIPLGVDQDGKIIAVESEEDAQRIKGVIMVLASPVQNFVCPRCSGQSPDPADEPSRIITL